MSQTFRVGDVVEFTKNLSLPAYQGAAWVIFVEQETIRRNRLNVQVQMILSGKKLWTPDDHIKLLEPTE